MLHPAIVASRGKAIHGVCLVANREIREGELVWELDEPIYSWKEIESWPEDRRRAFDWYGFQCGVDQYSHSEGLSREMNHSCDPNTWWSGSTKLIARRDIGAGEEVTYDYSTADIEHNSDMGCSCGSPRCRGTILSRDYQDPEWQSQYGTNRPPHVLAAIERAMRLVDRRVHHGPRPRIGVRHGDSPEARSANHVRGHFLCVEAVEQRVVEVRVSVRPAVDRDGLDVSGRIETAAREHPAGPRANLALDMAEQRPQQPVPLGPILLAGCQLRSCG